MAHIIVVDDEPFLRRILSYMLVGAGHRIECLEDGLAAWERLQHDPPPDLLITDLMMPGLSGIELVIRIRAHGDTTLPILVLTARGQSVDEHESERNGANAFMTKPFRSNELLEKVETLLRASRNVPISNSADAELGTGTDG